MEKNGRVRRILPERTTLSASERTKGHPTTRAELARWQTKAYRWPMAPYSEFSCPLSSKALLAISEALEKHFDSSDWARLGMELDLPELQNPGSRLQRSLRFGDDDYGACVIQVVRHLEDEHPSALRNLAQMPKLKAWLEAKKPNEAVELGLGQTHVPALPMPPTASDVVKRALQDADHLLHISGAVSALDRVHTALHGYLRDICAQSQLAIADDATVAQLFKTVRNKHPKFVAMNQHDSQVGNVLASLAGAVTALNTLRNNASVAHPNQVLLGEQEAMLMVNLVRTLFNYLEARL